MAVLQKGFTLVELSIVLIIIGLLFSLTIKAQAIIDNAGIKKDIKAIQGFKISYMLYLDKTGQLPGEDSNHPGRFKTVLSTETSPSEGLFYDLFQHNLTQKINPEPHIGIAFKATWGGSSGANYGLIAGQNQLCITEIDVNLAHSLEQFLDEGSRSSGDIEYTLNGSQLCVLMK